MRIRECIKWIWRTSDGIRGKVMLCAFAGIAYVCASLSFVWLSKRLVDIAVSSPDEPLKDIIIGMALCILFQIILPIFDRYLVSKNEVGFKNRLSRRLFRTMMEAQWNGKEAFHTGDTLNRVNEDVRVVSDAIIKSVPAMIIAGVQFIAAVFLLYSLAPGLALIIPVIMLLMLLLSKSYMKRMKRLTINIRKTESSIQSHMQESLQHRQVIHTMEQTPYVSGKLEELQDSLYEHVMSKTGYSIFTNTFVRAGFLLGHATVFLWGVLGIRSGAVTFGMMTAFLQLVGQIQRPIINASRQLGPLVNSVASAERLSEMEDCPKEESGDPIHLGNSVGVRLDDVSFRYVNGERKILDGLSCDFTPGSTTALLGETGAGKSTLMRLVLGLLSPDKGQVSIYNEGRTVKASPQTRCNIIYVPQGNTLMSGSVRDNLLLADPDASEEDLHRVLYLAAAEFVHDLPEGLNTLCGEKGAGLSEGQAQRISIARSLLRKGSILLLDEPTSALDKDTEQTLIDRLISGLEGRTIIIVTHRKEVADLCDSHILISE